MANLLRLKKPPSLPSRFRPVARKPAEVTDKRALHRERDGDPPHPKAWNNPAWHNKLWGTETVEYTRPALKNSLRVLRYKWVARLYTTFLSVAFEEHFGDVWINIGSFSFSGLPAWTTERLVHMAETMGGEEFQELAAKIRELHDAVK